MGLIRKSAKENPQESTGTPGPAATATGAEELAQRAAAEKAVRDAKAKAKKEEEEKRKAEAAAAAANTAKTEEAEPSDPAQQATANVPQVGVTRMQGLIYDNLENRFIAEYGVLPRLKASNGNIMDGDDKLLGDSVTLQILSWNLIRIVGPCDNKAPVDLVRYSYDGVTFDDGTNELVADYIAQLRGAWPLAASKTYGEIVGVLLESAKPSDLIGEMVQMQLAPTSLKAFGGFRLQHSFKISEGLASFTDRLMFTTQVVTAKTNTWTKLIPTAAKE